MYVPKKLKWDSLSDFKKHLEKETKEKIISFDGLRIITKTTEYGLAHGQLIITKPSKKALK